MLEVREVQEMTDQASYEVVEVPEVQEVTENQRRRCACDTIGDEDARGGKRRAGGWAQQGE